jgi:hypothetical protein
MAVFVEMVDGRKVYVIRDSVCAVCGRSMTHRRKGARTCGSVCRQRWYRHSKMPSASLRRFVKG